MELKKRMSELEPRPLESSQLVADIRGPIAAARRQSAVAVNMGLTLLYWRIGRRIQREVLGSECHDNWWPSTVAATARKTCAA